MNKFVLANNVEIPQIGFGPGIMWQSFPPMRIRSGYFNILDRIYNKLIYSKIDRIRYVEGIVTALNNGYRLLDNSSSYGNLNLLKEAIQKTGLNRNELFITDRISNQAQFKKNVRDSFFYSLNQLGLDYVDVLQIQWPVTEYYVDTWKELVKLYNEGYCKSIGVANCHQHHLQTLADETGIVPHINQIEVHPLFTQKELVSYCKKHKIQVEAYTPTARFDDRIRRLPLLLNIASNYNKNIVQVILRWHIQNGIIPIVRSFNNIHQISNINIFDFELTSEEMLAIDSININSRLRYDPDNCDFSIL